LLAENYGIRAARLTLAPGGNFMFGS